MPALHPPAPAGDFHQLPPVVRPREVRAAQEAAGVALLRALRTSPDGALTPEDIRRGSAVRVYPAACSAKAARWLRC